MLEEKLVPNHLKNIKLNITEPIKMDGEIAMGMLSLFAGTNGSGKSLMLKIAFALGATGIASDQGAPDLAEAAQFVWDHTFSEQNFDGTLEGVYTRGSLQLKFEKGKVLEATASALDAPTRVVFMSSDLRTFDAMGLYLRVRRNSGDPLTPEFTHKMLEAYRLYDFTYMESLINRCPILIPEHIVETLKTYGFEPEPTLLEVDLDSCTFNAALRDGSRKNVLTYGKGHQAILNMMLGVGT